MRLVAEQNFIGHQPIDPWVVKVALAVQVQSRDERFCEEPWNCHCLSGADVDGALLSVLPLLAAQTRHALLPYHAKYFA
jgi:hypothetical protein